MELLDPVEVRVLGALLEKEATTPEYYPLSLNALVNACNQKSNRDPVVEYDGDTVSDAIERLRQKKLALIVTGSGRVTKYGQRISETLNLGRRELAVLCTLLLRGPQTLGEIKDRSERMYAFADLSETEIVLEKLADSPAGSFLKKLPRQAGTKGGPLRTPAFRRTGGGNRFRIRSRACPVQSGPTRDGTPAVAQRVQRTQTTIRNLGSATALASHCAGNQAYEQDRQYQSRNRHVGPVSLQDESYQGYRHTRNGRGNQEQDSELDNGTRAQCNGAFHNLRYDAIDTGLAGEMTIVRRFATVPGKVVNTARENHRRCDEHAGPQQYADNAFDAGIRYSWRAHIRPLIPFHIISSAITPTTIANTRRKSVTGSRARKRAPIMDPANTPSITGMAIAGFT